MNFRHILCPTDLSPTGDGAVDLAYQLAADGGVVHLLHVCEPAFLMSPLDATPLVATPSTPEGQAALERRVHQHLRRLVPEAALARNVRTEFAVVHDVDPTSVIDGEAKRVAADLIVLGTHGRTGLGRALMGSVATDVLRKSRVPVILYHAGRQKA